MAHKIIRQHAESFSLPPEFTVIDPADAIDMMDVLRAERPGRRGQRRAPRGGGLRGYLHPVREHPRGRPEVMSASSRGAPFTELAGLFRAYTAHKRQPGICWTSTTCCCCGRRRWPTRLPARCCAACSTRSWSMSTRTSMRSKPASCGNSQLYHYFPDKNALVHAVIEHQADEIIDGQRPLLDQLDSLAAFQQWRDMLVDLQRQRHCEGRLPARVTVQRTCRDRRTRPDRARRQARPLGSPDPQRAPAHARQGRAG